jgi:cell division protease FtsH
LRRFFKSAWFPLLIVVVLAFFAHQLISPGQQQENPTFSEFYSQIDSQPDSIDKVTFNTKDNTLDVSQADGKEYSTGYPDNTEEALVNRLQRNDVQTEVEGKGGSSLLSLLTYVLPFILFFAFWVFLMNQMQGGGSKVMSFGKSRAKRMSVDAPKITFRDVAGVDEAVQELEEIKEFLENPKRFQSLGARIPKGVLLYGPPGTGKTLLARAVAGEAGVPFFSISGSDFVEMFVGVGASRVRDLFEQAKQNSPCIIFMDEIDAVGRHRGAGMGGGHDEREQTLNQLLVEMDGFEMKDNIILIAATNRPDILDPALLRPGRFDRQIVVDRPDRKGRKTILEVHTRGKPLAKDIDLDTLAGQTPGFTGADLANLINEAALLTARSNKREITMLELEEGIMRVIAGPEKKSRVMSEKERLITAYHELGHAIVGHLLPNCDPVHKVSIISRGQALGYTISLPTEDKFLTTRAELADTLAMTLGGRAAEEITFSEITTGAANDLEKVTQTAKQMVMRFGMSEKLGPRTFGHDQSQPFLGREFSAQQDYSDEIAREIDDEIRRIVEEAHQTAKEVLGDRREALDRLSKTLLQRETIEREEFEQLLAGKVEEEVFGPRPEPEVEPEPAREPERKPVAEPRSLPQPPRPGLAGGTAEIRGDAPRRPEL